MAGLTDTVRNDPSSNLPWFTVESQQRRVFSKTHGKESYGPSLIEHVHVNFMGKKDGVQYYVYMYFAEYKSRPSEIIAEISYSGDTMVATEMKNENFQLISYGKTHVELLTWFGLEIVFRSGGWSLHINVPHCYGAQKGETGNLEGLCGNYNTDSGDDYVGRVSAIKIYFLKVSRHYNQS